MKIELQFKDIVDPKDDEFAEVITVTIEAVTSVRAHAIEEAVRQCVATFNGPEMQEI